jgi:universal stress protein A
MENINRILVVSRGTTSSIAAVHAGVSLAKKYEAKLYIIHVIHDPFKLEGWNLPLADLEKDYQKLLKKMRRQLDDVINNESREGVQIEVLMPEGDPTEEVVKTVKEQKIDLLVLLAHEEGHVEHFLFGRSNQKLLLKMPCSILLVKKEPESCINKPFCN